MIARCLWCVVWLGVFLGHVAHAQTTPGILGIYSTGAAGKVQGGTAFLVSASGDIVTAYHVVQGATSISLQEPSRGAIETAGILVRAVDAQRDLAVLTVPALANRKGMALKARYPSPTEALKVIGYPRGMPNDAQISARTLKDQPVTAALSPFKDTQGRPLLNGNVEVIPLDMTIYGGVSGAPLIDAADSVVGVVSGSLNEGGSFAWAIPIAQVTALLEKGAAGRPLANYAWPEEALMAPWAKGSTRSYAMTTKDSFSLRVEYRKALAQYDAATEVLRNDVSVSTGMLDNVCSTLKIAGEYIPKRGKQTIDLEGYETILSFAEDAVARYQALLEKRIAAITTIRQFMKEIDALPDRADMPKSEGESLRANLQALELAEPELYSKSFEEIAQIDARTASKLREKLKRLQSKKGVSASDALDTSKTCTEVSTGMKRFERYGRSPDDRMLNQEANIYKTYVKLVDLTADFLVYK
jgi:hypothetical protein